MDYLAFAQALTKPITKEDIPVLVKGFVLGSTLRSFDVGFKGDKEQRMELWHILMPILLFGEVRQAEMSDELMDSVCGEFGKLKWLARDVLREARDYAD